MMAKCHSSNTKYVHGRAALPFSNAIHIRGFITLLSHARSWDFSVHSLRAVPALVIGCWSTCRSSATGSRPTDDAGTSQLEQPRKRDMVKRILRYKGSNGADLWKQNIKFRHGKRADWVNNEVDYVISNARVRLYKMPVLVMLFLSLRCFDGKSQAQWLVFQPSPTPHD